VVELAALRRGFNRSINLTGSRRLPRADFPPERGAGNIGKLGGNLAEAFGIPPRQTRAKRGQTRPNAANSGQTRVCALALIPLAL
jgi:hypothetical protein